jgi:hypothetical protein
VDKAPLVVNSMALVYSATAIMNSIIRPIRTLASVVLVLTVAACEDHSAYLAHEPKPHQWGSFGEELYRIALQAVSTSDTEAATRAARQSALDARQNEFVKAANNTLPPELYGPARQGLAELVERVDDQTMIRLTRSTGVMLDDLADDKATLAAALAWRDRPWNVGSQEVYRLVRHIALTGQNGQRALPLLVGGLLRLYDGHDGRSANPGSEPEEPREFQELQRALALSLADVDLSSWADVHELDSSLVEQLVAALAPGTTARPRYVVRTDHRGQPQVVGVPKGPEQEALFVDADSDGLVDVDDKGHLALAPGVARNQVAPYGNTDHHDTEGRAISADGTPLYEYVDFNETGVGALVQGFRSMALDGAHLEAMELTQHLLEPREERVDDRDGAHYRGMPATRADGLRLFFELAWAGLEGLRNYPPHALLAGLQELVTQERETLRMTLEQFMAALDIIDEVPREELRSHNTLLDDLLFAEYPPGAVCYGRYDNRNQHICEEPPGPLLPKLLESGILTQLLEAMDDPALEAFAPALVELMVHRDLPVEVEESRLVDLLVAGPESEQNRSIFQRLLHLVHDCNGAPFGTALTNALVNWQVQNMAVFFLESYCENDEPMMPGLVRFALGDYFPDSRPTAYEIAKFMVVDHERFSLSRELLLENPIGREGIALHEYNADTLLALEITGANQAIQAITQPFCQHGRPDDANERDHRGLMLLANLLSVVHEHYSTLPQYTTEMTQQFEAYGVGRPAGLRHLEQATARALSETDVLNQAFSLGTTLASVEAGDLPLGDEVAHLALHLLRPDGPVMLQPRSGGPEANRIDQLDGLTPASHPAHAHVVAHRLRDAIAQWDDQPQKVQDSLSDLVDLMGRYFLNAPGDGAMRRDQAEFLVTSAEKALPPIVEWASTHQGERWPERIVELRSDLEQMQEWVDDMAHGPLLPALVDVGLLVLNDPATERPLRNIVTTILTPLPVERLRPESPGDPWTTVARLVAGLVQVLPDGPAAQRLVRYAAQLVDPFDSPVATVPADLARITEGRADAVALTALTNSLATAMVAPHDDRPSFVVLADALVALGRLDPTNDTPLTEADLRALLSHAQYHLGHHQHGLERLYAIIGKRFLD